MNVLFARWLSADAYGLFSISFSAYLFMVVIHWGAFIEPLLVLSPLIDLNRRRSYIITLVYAHLLLLLAAIVVSAVGYVICLHYDLPNAALGIIGASVCGVMMVTLLTARRLCLVFESLPLSAVIGSVYFGGVLITGSILSHFDLTWFALWEIMGLWSLLCAAIIFWRLCRRMSGNEPFPLARLFEFQRRYAPGAILSTICTWGSFEGVMVLLSMLVGLRDVAETRAVFTLANPLVQANASLHANWLFLFSERRDKPMKISVLLTLFVAGTAACVGFFAFAATPLVHWFFAGKYVSAAWQLPILIASIGFNGLTAIITSIFKAQGGLWQGFVPGIVDAVVALALGFVLISLIGQAGAVYAICAGGIASLVVTCLFYWLAFPKTKSLV